MARQGGGGGCGDARRAAETLRNLRVFWNVKLPTAKQSDWQSVGLNAAARGSGGARAAGAGARV